YFGFSDTIMSDSEDSTVTYTIVSSPCEGRSGDISPGVDGPSVMPDDPYAYVVAAFQALPSPDYVPSPEEPEQAPPSPVYIPYVPAPVYPEYIPPEDDVFPAEEQPLPAAASPTADLPGYIPESDLDEDPEEDDDEDPKEDLADYPADHDDEEEEEESSRDDADEENKEQDDDDDDEEEEHPALAGSIPPPHALRVTARISFRPQPPTLFFTKEDVERFLAMPIPPPSSLTLLSSPLPQIPSPPPQHHPLSSPYHYLLHHHPYSYYLLTVEQIDPRLPCHLERDVIFSCELKKMAPKNAAPKRTTRLNSGATSNPNQAPSTTTTTVTNAQLQAMINQGVNVALAACDAKRTGDDSHTSGTGVRRTERVTQECTYQDFMKCQPLYFKGTKEVVKLTQWFERMETVFCISNCLAENQIKFATCTLLAGALTWWNSHVRIVGNDAAYVMTWIELKKKMADKYCSRNEIKKIETEFWNLEVQGTDVTRYNQRF
nr:hypothetical protein [Tanacetum cinerariifolium]GFB09554.1 hypothetical protein [Tanacetum cinerariifolium]